MGLRYVLGLVWKWSWLFVLAPLLFGGALYLYVRSLPPAYRATATLLVTQINSRDGVASVDLVVAERLARTYAQLITEYSVITNAANALEMNASYEQVRGLVTVEIVRETQLLRISAEGSDPEIAAKLANQVALEFIRQNDERQTAPFKGSQAQLRLQVDRLGAVIADTSTMLDNVRNQPSPASETRQALLEQQLADLQRDYALLKDQLGGAQATQNQPESRISIIGPALPSSRPIRPNVPLYVLIGAMLGLLLAALIAVLVEQLDDRLRTPERVFQRLQLPILGQVGRFRFDDSPCASLAVVQADSRSAVGGELTRRLAAEAYRAIRVNLRYASFERPLSRLVVTSSHPSEGKTITAANLACTLAQSGLRVILIDADLRRPSLHRVFGMDNGAGVSSALLSPLPERDALPLHQTLVPGLLLMTAGPIPPNASELLASDRLQQLLDLLASDADLLVIDTPPVLAVSDPLPLAASVDGAILVLDASRIRAGAALQAKVALERAGVNLFGVVLNKARSAASNYHAAYYEQYDSAAFDVRPARDVQNGTLQGEHDELPAAEAAASRDSPVPPGQVRAPRRARRRPR